MFWKNKPTRSIPVAKATEAGEFYTKTLKQLMSDKQSRIHRCEEMSRSATLEIFGQLDDEWSDYDTGK